MINWYHLNNKFNNTHVQIETRFFRRSFRYFYRLNEKLQQINILSINKKKKTKERKKDSPTNWSKVSHEISPNNFIIFPIPQKKNTIVHPTSYVCNTFRIFSNRIERKERKKRKRKIQSWMARGRKKKRKVGGDVDRIFWRLAKAVDTRFAERRHEACRASTTPGVPTSLPDERRRISVPRNVVERASSACRRRRRRRPIPLLFVSRFNLCRDRDMWRELEFERWRVNRWRRSRSKW